MWCTTNYNVAVTEISARTVSLVKQIPSGGFTDLLDVNYHDANGLVQKINSWIFCICFFVYFQCIIQLVLRQLTLHSNWINFLGALLLELNKVQCWIMDSVAGINIFLINGTDRTMVILVILLCWCQGRCPMRIQWLRHMRIHLCE